MIADILTVMWKERKGLLKQRGSRVRALWVLLIPAIMLGILLPWQEGHGWIEGYWSLIGSILIPILLVSTFIPESFAGERERHTLGTLLASRLPDRAILFGKILIAVIYAWGVSLCVLLLELITVNITGWDGRIVFFPADVLLIDIVLGLLLACFMAGIGVMISLRASTVQGATMTLMATTFLPLIILQVVGMVLLQKGSGGRERIMEFITTVDWMQVIMIIMLVMVVASVGAIWAAMVRFQRGRLLFS
jgi:ABC-2 type transport system permease protein